jgi:3-oxoacyl-[acyl-carrier-protein] synthase-1
MGEIVITGMGIVSAIGMDVEQTLQSLLSNRSGIGALRYLKTSHSEFPVGEVKMSNEEMMASLGIPDHTPTTRTSLMGMLALRQALQMAFGNEYRVSSNEYRVPSNEYQVMKKSDSILGTNDLILDTNNLILGTKIAFVNGTTVGGMDKSEQYYLDFLNNDTKNAYLATHDCGACTEMIADYFGIFSQVDTISTACSSAANAIMLGAELLKAGRADIVVAGGAECITKFHLNGFNALMILDKQPCRPFCATRAGLNLGEGAAYLVMQRNEPRHAKALAALTGYANTCDAYHQTATSPNGEGAYLAMKKALESANLQPSDIDYINAHGTGTQNNDLCGGRAIVRLFGGKIPPLSSTKAFTGHTTSAAGGVEAVISILALQHNFIPSNLNFKHKMEELPFAPYLVSSNEYLVSSIKAEESLDTKNLILNTNNLILNTIMSNSFGFGGNDTSLIFSKIQQNT